STRSNRWDAVIAAKAFRSRRTCTPPLLHRIPGVLTLGSRGNPTHVEHRRQRHNKIDSESASVTRIRSPKFTRCRGGLPGFNARLQSATIRAAVAVRGSVPTRHARVAHAHAR